MTWESILRQDLSDAASERIYSIWSTIFLNCNQTQMLVLHLNLFQHSERLQIITLLFKRNIELKTIHFEYEFDHDDDQNRINCGMSNKKQIKIQLLAWLFLSLVTFQVRIVYNYFGNHNRSFARIAIILILSCQNCNYHDRIVIVLAPIMDL